MELTACDEQDVNKIVDDRRCAEGVVQSIFFKKLTAFTLAEILLSLSIIGIVAAIALPSLLGNVNERAFETQKKALYTRFSQAIPLLPSLNGYGELVGNLSDCEDTNSCVNEGDFKDTAAESFIRDGLSKVMKVTNICDSEHLTDCGLPDKIIPINNGTAINLSSISTMSGLNTRLIQSTSVTEAKFETLNTKTSAFETVNGESVLVYYNPNCEPDLGELMYRVNTVEDTLYRHFSQPKMCANFIYDLNGKKGPNTVGKDIGTITVLYSTDPVIISPNPYPNDTTNSESPDDITEKCKEKEDERVATIDELTAMFVNYKLYNYKLTDHYRSITKYPKSTRSYWMQANNGMRWIYNNQQSKVRCVKR